MARVAEPTPMEALASLQSALERGGLLRGYALRGEERYFRERAIELVRRAAETSGHEVAFHDGERGNPDFELAHLIDDLSGGGLFGRRLVVVRHSAEHLKKIEGADSELTRALLAFIAIDAGTVVLSDSSLRADHPVAKAIAAAGGSVLSFRKLYDSPPPWKPASDPAAAELVLWARQRGQELGVRLDPSQALYVCAATGNDLFDIDEKLRLLASSGGRNLRAVVGWTAGGTPWAVAEALAGGDLARGLAGVEALFRAGFQDKEGRRVVEPSALANMTIATLQRSARAALAVTSAVERGASETEAASAAELGGPPIAVQSALARARRRSSAQWRALLADAALLERAAKSQGADANDFARFALRWAVQPGRKR